VQYTLDSMCTRVAFATGLSNATGSSERALVSGYLNEAQTRFLEKTHCITSAATPVVDCGDVLIDTPILTIDNVMQENGSAYAHASREAVFIGRNSSAQRPIYALAGANRLMLAPTPEDGTKIYLYYVPMPPDLVNGGDVPLVPAQWCHALESYAKWTIGSTDEHRGSQIGMLWKQEWDEAIVEAKAANWRRGGRVREGLVPLVR
jgi:hypothetical protein